MKHSFFLLKCVCGVACAVAALGSTHAALITPTSQSRSVHAQVTAFSGTVIPGTLNQTISAPAFAAFGANVNLDKTPLPFAASATQTSFIGDSFISAAGGANAKARLPGFTNFDVPRGYATADSNFSVTFSLASFSSYSVGGLLNSFESFFLVENSFVKLLNNAGATVFSFNNFLKTEPVRFSQVGFLTAGSYTLSAGAQATPRTLLVSDPGGLRQAEAFYAFNFNAQTLGSVTAVPEPTTYALMLIGLAAVGGVAARSRTQ